MDTLRTAVIGVGYFGRLHAEKYAALPGCELMAVVDVDPVAGQEVAEQLGVPCETDCSRLFGHVDAVSIAVPTRQHYVVAKEFIRNGVHVLVEKPIAATAEEARSLVDLASRHNVVLQIGHVERVNATVQALDGILDHPLYIESNRVAPFKPRGVDVDVVMDLMIHDIDIVLSLVDSPLEDVEATGVAVFSHHSDIANARLRFACGCVANLTASRAALKSERKMRIFQHDAYVGIDLKERRLTVRRKGPRELFPGVPEIVSDDRQFPADDSLRSEIGAFLESVRSGKRPPVTGEEGRRALETAIEISSNATVLGVGGGEPGPTSALEQTPGRAPASTLPR